MNSGLGSRGLLGLGLECRVLGIKVSGLGVFWVWDFCVWV